jgi:hypothetical protein
MASYARLLLLVKTVRPFLRATQAVNLTWSVRGRSRGGLLVGFLPPLQVSYSPDRLIENVALHTYHWSIFSKIRGGPGRASGWGLGAGVPVGVS